MTRLEQHGAVAFAFVTAARRRRLGACLMGMALADTFFLTTVKPSSFIFARTSYTSRQRKLAVSAIVRPWSSSFLRSLISASDQGSPEFASHRLHSGTTERGRGGSAQSARTPPASPKRAYGPR
jgi:hypothetical protein